MRTNPTLLVVIAALLAGSATAAGAGVDEPSTAQAYARSVRPGTSLGEDQVRPLDRSRKPVPAIERDVVRPDPPRSQPVRSAEDEVVRPVRRTFKSERSLDDALARPPQAARTRKAAPAQPGLAPRGMGQTVAEDPGSRANETARPGRRGRTEP